MFEIVQALHPLAPDLPQGHQADRRHVLRPLSTRCMSSIIIVIIIVVIIIVLGHLVVTLILLLLILVPS